MTLDARSAISALNSRDAVRPADYADIPALVELGRAFFIASDMESLAAFCPESFAISLHNMIGAEDAILLAAEVGGNVVGFAGAMVFPSYWNSLVRIGQETFFWINPSHRGKLGGVLLEVLQQEAKYKGARSFLMVALEALRPSSVGKLYTRNGYRPLEHSYWKAL
jgi:GNAT superfamily N-acetyltransferase